MRSVIYLLLFFFALPLFSEERKHGGKAIEVKVEAGTSDGQLIFTPNEFTFEFTYDDKPNSPAKTTK